jgi:peptidoglycan hydrolase FlgJ
MNSASLSGVSSLSGDALYRANASLKAGGSPLDLAKVPGDVKRAAEDFEAFFLTQTMASMFEGLDTDPLFGGGPGESTYRSFLTQEYGKIVAKAGGIGIADAVAREIIKLQEAV